MTTAQLIAASLLITAICVAVLVAVLRSIAREVGGLGDADDESQAARSKGMSDEELMDAKQAGYAKQWKGGGR